MATGEVRPPAASAAFGHGRQGHGPVHVITVNDYLAKRDAQWMQPVYDRLGITVGYVTEASTPEERWEAYAQDVTYVSINEAGFDYLRDQLGPDYGDRVQPPLGTGSSRPTRS
jgi:preprotein translocase subunit SecA